MLGNMRHARFERCRERFAGPKEFDGEQCANAWLPSKHNLHAREVEFLQAGHGKLRRIAVPGWIIFAWAGYPSGVTVFCRHSRLSRQGRRPRRCGAESVGTNKASL